VSDVVIAIDDIEVTACQFREGEIFRAQVDKINIKRTNIHEGVGASRVVSTIQMLGSYTSIEENAGDFLILTWEIGSTDPEDVVISLEGRVSLLGETV
jgi:hypothetical protein